MGLLSTYNSEYSWQETRKGTAFVGQHLCDQEVWQISTAISREGWTSLGRDQHSACEWCSYKQVSGPTLSTASESLQCNPVLKGPPETLLNGLDAPSPAAWRFSGKLKGKILMGHWHQKVYQWQVVDLIRMNTSTKEGELNTEGKTWCVGGQSWYFLILEFRGWSHLGGTLDGASGTGA